MLPKLQIQWEYYISREAGINLIQELGLEMLYIWYSSH